MINDNHETYVTLQTAQLLSKVGYDWKCKTFYSKQGRIWSVDNTDKYEDELLCPTQSVVRKWLREKRNINIEIEILSITGGCLCWYFKLYKLDVCNGIYHHVNEVERACTSSYSTYEESLEIAIQTALTLE